MGLSYFYVWSRFHALAEFDEVKRSCRKRLADHNRRRRKSQPGTTSDSPARKTLQNGIDKNQETEKTRGLLVIAHLSLISNTQSFLLWNSLSSNSIFICLVYDKRHQSQQSRRIAVWAKGSSNPIAERPISISQRRWIGWKILRITNHIHPPTIFFPFFLFW